MGYRTRGLRGSVFEDLINMTNETYRQSGLAVVQKISTPIVPTKLDGSNISQAYFDKKSTVDYIGVAQGVAICFDAKQTGQKNFPMQNIHAHQVEFMKEFAAHKGVAFFLINFTLYGKTFFLPIEDFLPFWDAGKKSMKYQIFEDQFPHYEIKPEKKYIVHYLKSINQYLSRS